MRVLLASMIVVIASLGADHSAAKPGKEGHGALPPGLQKKAARGEPLPPGWQKKLAVGDVLDESIYARGDVVVPMGNNGSISIEIDGTILRLNAKTRKVLEIL